MEHASDPMAEPSTSSECVRDELHFEAGRRVTLLLADHEEQEAATAYTVKSKRARALASSRSRLITSDGRMNESTSLYGSSGK